MAVRIGVVSQKGGVGKTTVCLNLGLALAERKNRVLLVDLDPQGGIGLALARGEQEWAGLAEILMGQVEPQQGIIHTKLPTLSILARGKLDPADAAEFELEIQSPGLLGKILGDIEKDFDYVLMDTPGGLGLISRAALNVANFALIPFQAEPLALRSIGQVLRVVERVRATENPNIELLGILPTMVDAMNDYSKVATWTVWSGFAGVLDNFIPRSEVFSKSSHLGLPVSFLGGMIKPEARRFDALAAEVEGVVNQFLQRESGDVEREQRELV